MAGDSSESTEGEDVVGAGKGCTVTAYSVTFSVLTTASPTTELCVMHVLIIAFHVKRSRGEMYSGHGRLSVCLSVCPLPHSYTARGNGRGALQLCTTRRIYNRCTGFAAMTIYTYVSV